LTTGRLLYLAAKKRMASLVTISIGKEKDRRRRGKKTGLLVMILQQIMVNLKMNLVTMMNLRSAASMLKLIQQLDIRQCF